MSDAPEVMDEDMLMHRIKAHLASPGVYDPPTFKEMADRIKELGLREMQLIGESLEDAKRIKELEAQLEKAVSALQVCEQSLNEYIRAEYPYNHPVHVSKMQRDIDSNPATIVLAELKGETP